MSKKPPPTPPPILSPPPPPPHQPKKQPPPRKILSPPAPPPHPPPSAPPPPPPPPPSPPLQQPISPPSPSTGDNKTYRDCIPGICSINCPQFCTFLPFPPPPPFFLNSTTSDDDSNKISPLMATLIAVLATAFLLLFYYTVISRYLRRRRHRHRRRHLADVTSSSEIRLDPLVQDPTRPAGIDDSFIRQITVFKYRRGDGLVEGTECAICLSEFSENESLRLMPNCEHAFHIPCIDTWLRSHSNCPLCRSGMDPVDPVRPDPSRAGGVMLAHMRIHRSDDTVLVVREEEGEVIVCHDIEERENGEIKTNPSPLL